MSCIKLFLNCSLILKLAKNLTMTIVIKKHTDKITMQKLIGSMTKKRKFDAKKFCGKLKVNKSPIEIQNEMRNEWK